MWLLDCYVIFGQLLCKVPVFDCRTHKTPVSIMLVVTDDHEHKALLHCSGGIVYSKYKLTVRCVILVAKRWQQRRGIGCKCACKEYGLSKGHVTWSKCATAAGAGSVTNPGFSLSSCLLFCTWLLHCIRLLYCRLFTKTCSNLAAIPYSYTANDPVMSGL